MHCLLKFTDLIVFSCLMRLAYLDVGPFGIDTIGVNNTVSFLIMVTGMKGRHFGDMADLNIEMNKEKRTQQKQQQICRL